MYRIDRPWMVMIVLLSLVSMQALAAGRADRRFVELHEREWTWRQAEFPQFAASIGDPAEIRTLGQVDATAQARRLKHWQDVREQLGKIDPAELNPQHRVDAAVYGAQLDELIAGIESRVWLLPMNSDSSFWGDLAQGMSAQRLRTVPQAEAYLARLEDLPRYFEQHEALLDEGLRTGMTVQQIVLDGREQPIKDLADQDVEATPYFQPFLALPPAWSDTDQNRLRERAREVITKQVQPAYRRLHTYLSDTYIPGARKTLAAHALPEGDAFYRHQIKIYTTLDLAPETIHDIGLKEVSRILAEMETVKQEAGFEGDLAAFIAFLRTDPQFYAQSPRALLERASYIAKRVDGLLPRYFGHLPRQPYGVEPVPASIAPFYTAGRYVPGSLDAQQAGTYWVNTFKLEARPLYALPALTLHEAVPGHHLQGAIASEADSLPPFRRYSYISAYGEGWALYTEFLGKEMGIYETPYEHFGRLTYEMWRACRLVVDTGIHAKGWSREQARTYLGEHTALSLHEVNTEVDRYISWPGQALSYKLGEIEIRKLRGEAEQALGANFDLRAFHDRILGLGSVPLPVLRAEIEAWIKDQSDKP